MTDSQQEKLSPFEGTFRAQVRLWMGPGDPTVSTGTMINEFELGRRFLRQTYTGDPAEGPLGAFEGRGYWGYNSVDEVYEGFWIDTASPMMQIERGGVDETGRVWTMLGEMTHPETGARMTKRSVITLVDRDHHTMEMYFDAGDGESKSMEISYERAT